MRPLRLLHLEDDEADAELAWSMLEREGLHCDARRVATRAAFEAALADPALDVILADYSLPGFDGATALAHAQARRPEVPFLFVSGTLGEDVAVEQLKNGACDYVVKQRLVRLPAAVRRAVREAEERAGRVRAERELRELNADLERRVAARTAELASAEEAARVARVEAERANVAKSEFLSRMSHDLRTPLNAILGFAQLLELDVPAEQSEPVQQILRGGRHLLELIDEVLDIARIETGGLSLSLEPVSVSEIVASAADLVAPLARRRRIAVGVDLGPVAGCFAIADRQRLNQALLNLLSNGVKYNRTAGRLTVSGEQRPGGFLRIRVRDTGDGMTPAQLERLFTPFERLDADHRGIEGTGLGLALTRTLVEAMGGAVGVESTVHVGSTFWIDLRAAESPETALLLAPFEREPASVASLQGTVLYVEDNRSNVRLLERVLARRPGVRLLSAGQGQLGIDMAREYRPDLVLLDVHLPDISGEEVLRRIRADERTRDIPVAMLTADATPQQRRRLVEHGAGAYLTKPFDVRELLRLIDDTLTNARHV
jgi:signal transduction histidine kinase